MFQYSNAGVLTTKFPNVRTSSGSEVAVLARDNNGNFFVSSSIGNKILKGTPDGIFTLFAGSGASGATDGPGTSASFHGPGAMGVDSAGNLYVTDTPTQTIRRVLTTGVVTTVAHVPVGLDIPIAVDAAGTVFVTNKSSVYRVDGSTCFLQRTNLLDGQTRNRLHI